MKRKLKTSQIVVGCAGLFLLGVIVAGFLAYQGITLVAGKPYFNTPRDKAKLRTIRDPYRDVPAALEAHRTAHGRYPEEGSGIDVSVPGGSNAAEIFRKGPLRYSSGEPSTYSIYLKLNWDGGLVYSSFRPEWVYDPGTGDPSWKID